MTSQGVDGIRLRNAREHAGLTLRDEIGALPDVDAQREVLEGIAAVYREVLGSDNPVAANQWVRQFVAVEVLSNERCDVTLG